MILALKYGRVFQMAEKAVLETVKWGFDSLLSHQERYGCSSDWLECLSWEQEVAGSNPVTRTIINAKSIIFLLLAFISYTSMDKGEWREEQQKVVMCLNKS